MTSTSVLSRVSVVIVTTNARSDVLRCLRSLDSDQRLGAEILVVDNASTDGTVDAVRSKFPSARVIQSDQNLGYSAANNLGVRHSTREFVFILNPDAELLSASIAPLVDHLERHADVGIVAPKIVLSSDHELINTYGNAFHYTGITTCRDYLLPASGASSQERILAVSGAAFLMRRALFTSLGGLDESMFTYLEDTDLSLRLRLDGHAAALLPAVTVAHDFEPTFSPGKIFRLERNRYLLLLKTYRWRTLLLMAPVLVLIDLSVLVYCATRGPRVLARKLASYAWLATNWRTVLRARRSTQRRRRVPDAEILADAAARLDLRELDSSLVRAVAPVGNAVRAIWFRVLKPAVRW